MSGGGGGGETSTELSDFAKKGVKPYRNDLMGFGQQYDPQFYGGQTYADQSGYTQQGISGLGGVDYNPTLDLYKNTIGGDYLGLNPAMQQAVMNPAMDAVDARMGAAGRFGSPANAYMSQKAGMEALMPYYNQERARQMQAGTMYPMAQEQAARTMLGAGQLEEQYAQRPIDEAMSRWQFEQNQPLQRMQGWGSLFAPLGGGSVTTMNQGGGSGLAGAAGGALSGGAMAAAIPALASTGWGIPVAAGLGALGGYYGSS